MKEKTAVITGASSGIGRRLALEAAARGARVVLAARTRSALDAVGVEIGDPGRVLIRPTDVTDPQQCRDLIQAAVEGFGGIDFLVLNAGLSMWSRFEDISDLSVFSRLMESNYLSSVYCVHAALPYLKQSGGTIVAVTSTQAVIGLPRHSAYSASKHAVRGFLGALELELEGSVRFLEVMPGWVKGTNLRSTALKGDGGQVGEDRRAHGKDAVTAEECARRIADAMASGRRELYVPSKLRFVPWVKLIAPGWLKRKIRKAVNRK